MLRFGAVRLTAVRRGSRPGHGPNVSFPAQPPTHTFGHKRPLVIRSEFPLPAGLG